MKLFHSCLILFMALVQQQSCYAQEGDCSAIIRERDELFHSREAIIREKDEIWHNREAIIQELQQLRTNFEAEIQQLRTQLEAEVNAGNEARRALEQAKEVTGGTEKQIDELNATIEKQKKDIEHTTKVAQDNQKFMTEYKNQLASQRDRATKLDQALKIANAKIEELESTTFIKQLQKEVSAGWKSVIDYWNNVRGKGKEGEL